MNKSSSPIHRLLLRGIAIFYTLLFLSGLISSAYLLRGIVQLKPIPLGGLLKYILLCFLFLILLLNAVRALTLKTWHLSRLAGITKNFKWLFTLSVMICIAAKAGLFSLNRDHPVEVTYIQIVILTIIAAFCYWSDNLLREEGLLVDEEPEEENINP